MKTTITREEFIHTARNWPGREQQFSYEGLAALFDYLEEYEESTGEAVEFDFIALCCDFNEYDSAYEAMQQYQPDDMPVAEDTGVDENGHGMDLTEIAEAQEKMAHEWLEEHTTVIDCENGHVIIANF